ncbi:hypothetical protein RD792_009068 [Penstemon davidsonii]|uniref:Cytochrome P450 n=1 Tax=Penstemon davidsonii TaxID=160366 RepID=A0ABR0DAW6_9LAMI|nr:hypothetical protein RD792_009068 [Penstemon davidsonii]
MDQFYIIALSISLTLVSIIWFMIKKPTSKSPPLPPGPRGLPIVGYLPYIGKNLLVQFTELAHQYGPIYKLHLGHKLWVVVSSPSITKEVVRDNDLIFANRSVSIGLRVATYGGSGVVWSPNDPGWRLMRKIFVHEMISPSSLEASYNLRKDVVRKTIKNIYHNKAGKAIQMRDLCFLTVLNIVINLMWGGTIEGEEGERIVTEFNTVVERLLDLTGKGNISDFFPFLAGLDLQGVKRDMESHVECMDKMFDAVIDLYQDRFNGKGNEQGRKDFLQLLLKLKEDKDSEMGLTQQQFRVMMMDFIAGGTSAQSTAIEWAMAELLKNPEIMAKVQEELSAVVGENNIVEESHMSKLKYMEAVFKESLRLHPAIPFLIPRSPIESSIIGGYTIPKKTTVFVNVWSIQRDPSIWENPLEFRPQRFLDENQNLDYSGNNFNYFPFGSGRRICAGMPLAERMSFYILASLLHSFEWRLPEGEELDMAERFGIVLRKTKPLVALPTPRLSDSNLYA